MRRRRWLSIVIVAPVVCGYWLWPPTRDRQVPATALHLAAEGPYLGVSCAQGNSFACDRIGIAVWLSRDDAVVTVTIARRVVALERVSAGEYQGFLQPAGLLAGPSRITPDASGQRWMGRHERPLDIIINARAAGRRFRTRRRVLLHPGWG